jgi:hypothetical protein
MTRSLAIVAFAADRPLSPRGERAHAVARAAHGWLSTELIGPAETGRARQRARQLTRLASPFMLDAWEPEARLTLCRRRLCPDIALLVGFPFSGVYWAVRRLVAARVPYVVDLGDPWALTLPPGERPSMGVRRAARCEEFVWRFAAAGVLTTQLQADGIRALFPGLPLVVRPNGYRPVRHPPAPPAGPRRDRTLRLVHYGNLYRSRLEISSLITRLATCGRWDSVVLTQQGEDWTGALRGLPPAVRVDVRPQQPWEEVVRAAADHDLALVVGNRNPAQLPSKAVQYLTLPIPRLAVVGGDSADALTGYVREKPGWLTLRNNAPAELVGAAVAAHLSRTWSAEALAPPPQESWEAVAQTLLEFTLRCARPMRGAGPPHPTFRAIPAASSNQPRW